jgi:aminomethyltransferase
MPVPTPFHARTSALCTSLFWKDWAGYYAVRSYDTYVEREYFAIRHAAGLIDVTPLFKYEVFGADASAFLSRIMTRNVAKLKVGQVAYACWCDEEGKVIDDGTVARLDDTYFRVTANESALAWFQRFTRGYEVTIEDSCDQIGALSLQGPSSRSILNVVSEQNLNELRFFWVTQSKIEGADVQISRTGFTGDLGFEVWVRNEDALKVYDAIMAAGKPYGILAAGLDAMDMTRLEAGYVIKGVDYYNANRCLIEARKSTPYELGLGWLVHLKRDAFNGHLALRKEKKEGPKRLLVGLDIDWDEHEALFAEHNLPIEIPGAPWRHAIPVYDGGGQQIGYANSGTWSPILKKNIALATVKPQYGKPGAKVKFEVTVEYRRRMVTATVVERPFFDPERKRA